MVVAHSGYVARLLASPCIQCGECPSCFALSGRPDDAVLDCHVCGLCIEACVLGGTERSCRRCTGPAFRKISIFPDVSYLLLLATWRVPGYSIQPWAYKRGPSSVWATSGAKIPLAPLRGGAPTGERERSLKGTVWFSGMCPARDHLLWTEAIIASSNSRC